MRKPNRKERRKAGIPNVTCSKILTAYWAQARVVKAMERNEKAKKADDAVG